MGEDGEQNQAEKGSELLPLNPSASDPIQYLHDVLYVVESDFCMWRRPAYFVRITKKEDALWASPSMDQEYESS
jgi:hypothetical protein